MVRIHGVSASLLFVWWLTEFVERVITQGRIDSLPIYSEAQRSKMRIGKEEELTMSIDKYREQVGKNPMIWFTQYNPKTNSEERVYDDYQHLRRVYYSKDTNIPSEDCEHFSKDRIIPRKFVKEAINHLALKSRTLTLYKQTAYVTDTYTKPIKKRKMLVRVIRVPYNSKKFKYNGKNETYRFYRKLVINPTEFEKIYQAHYLPILDVIVYLKITKTEDDQREVAFYRGDTGQSVQVVAKLKGDYSQVQPKMKIFPATDSNYEVFIFGLPNKVCYYFMMSKTRLFDPQNFSITDFSFIDVHYYNSFLLIVSGKKRKLGDKEFQENSLYMHRPLNKKIDPDAFQTLGRCQVVSTESLLETPDIGIDCLSIYEKAANRANKLRLIVYRYEFNIFNRKMTLVKSKHIFMAHQSYISVLDTTLKTFSLHENTYLLLRIFAMERSVKRYFGNRFSWSPDSGDTTDFWRDPKRFVDQAEMDDSLDQLIILTNLAPFDLKIAENKCSILKQRLYRNHWDILAKDKKNLTVSFSYHSYSSCPANQTSCHIITYQFKIQYLTPQEIKNQHYDIWEQSPQTEYSNLSPKFGYCVKLEELVGGNYANLDFDFDSGAQDYANKTFDIHEKILQNAFYKTIQMQIRDKQLFKFGARTLRPHLGFIRQDQKGFKLYYFLIKPSRKENLKIYLKEENYMVLKKDLMISEHVKSVFFVKPNHYLLLLESGNFLSLDSETLETEYISYSGANCKQVVRLFHKNLRQALLCLNSDMELVVYYVNELVERSLSNTHTFLENLPKNLKISRNSLFRTSPSYPNLVFILTPNRKLRKNLLQVVILETRHRLELQIELSQEIRFAEDHLWGHNSLVESFEVVNSRGFTAFQGLLNRKYLGYLLFHLRGSQNENVFDLYTYLKGQKDDANNDDANGYLKLVKSVKVPSHISIDENARLLKIQRRVINDEAASSKPLFFIKVNLKGAFEPSNMLAIDPISPNLGTFPFFLLPRHNKDSLMVPFQIYSQDSRYDLATSIGLYFAKIEDVERFKNVSAVSPIFFFEADSPKICFSSKKNGFLPHEMIFETKNSQKEITKKIKFTSMIAKINRPGLNESRYTITKTLTFTSDIIKELMKKESLGKKPLKIMNQNSLNSFDGTNYVPIYRKPFSSIVKSSMVVNWDFKAESVFDQISQVFKYTKPIERLRTVEGVDFKDLQKHEKYCVEFQESWDGYYMPYKMDIYRLRRIIEKVPTCLRYAHIFFMKDKVAITQKSSLKELNSPDDFIVIKLPQEPSCSQPFAMYKYIIRYCNSNQIILLKSFDLMTFKQSTKSVVTHRMREKLMDPSGAATLVTQDRDRSFLILKAQSFLSENEIVTTGKSYLRWYSDSYWMSRHHSWHVPLMRGIRSYSYSSISSDTTVFGIYSKNKYRMILGEAEVSSSRKSSLLVCLSFYGGLLHILSNEPWVYGTGAHKYLGCIIFTVKGLMSYRTQALKGVQIKWLDKHNDTHPLISTKTNFTISYLMHLPNYHSFIVMLNKFSKKLDNSSIYRLFNPFSNYYPDPRQNSLACHKWACVFIYTFNNHNYLVFYDTKPEWRDEQRKREWNFERIFKLKRNFNKRIINQKLILDKVIDSKETFFPIFIKKFEGQLEQAIFDYNISSQQPPYPTYNDLAAKDAKNKECSEEDSQKKKQDYDSAKLHLTLFFSNKTEQFEVSRDFILSVHNIYLSSKQAELEIEMSFGEKRKIPLHLELDRETTYFKHWLHLMGIMALGFLYCFGFKRFIKKVEIPQGSVSHAQMWGLIDSDEGNDQILKTSSSEM